MFSKSLSNYWDNWGNGSIIWISKLEWKKKTSITFSLLSQGQIIVYGIYQELHHQKSFVAIINTKYMKVKLKRILFN